MTIHTLQAGFRSFYRYKAILIKVLHSLEQFYILLALLLFSQSFLTILQGGSAAESITDGNPLVQKIWAFIYAVALLLCCIRWRAVIIVIRQDKLLLLLTFVVILSLTWSAAPEMTLRRSFALIGTNLFGLYMAIRFSLKQQFKLVSRMLLVVIVFSFLFGLFLPQYGVMSDNRGTAWQGVLSHKNQLGRLMCFSSVLFFVFMFNKGEKKKLIWLGLGGSFLLMLLSTSKTALVIMLVLLMLIPFLQSFRWNISIAVLYWMFALLIAGGAISLLFSNADLLLSLMDRDVTLTGRTDLWAAVWEMIKQRPLLGYGYNGFWLGLDGESAYVWLVTKWDPPHSHNGLLDVWLDLGVVGVILVLLHMIRGFKLGVTYIRQTRTIISFCPLLYFMFMFLYNLTENTILRPNSVFWVLYVSISLSLSIAIRRHKRKENKGGIV
ncbi:ligase [Paenibacillus baekrokdamisoli]|uniref:Ligase n=1 Tax=Paenibacillus baekrokdamisoli TaxID=1712516 RepID=A0A3G9JAD1_9BACL|nr:O-antigen ligase [Paenibacillus baekrokdamisoli]MBB3071647.1 O-antigen ligase [Paenibacillus baekrokdamisoli]BBH21843.1 ligase [Paenibacillus baekrokdamisoli]